MALLPPTPSASAKAAAMVNAGARERVRRAYFRSWRTLSMAGGERVPCQKSQRESGVAPDRSWEHSSRKWDRRFDVVKCGSDVRLSPTCHAVLNAASFLKECRN